MTRALIEADAGKALAALAPRLIARAAALAAARVRYRRQHETRWRRAGLLWPLFAKG